MAWISIAEADVLTVVSGTELAAWRAIALKAGQADPLAPTIASAIDMVRGYVGACATNTLGPAATVPQELLAPALDIVACRLGQRVGAKPSEVRKTAYDDAIKLLQSVAKGEFAIAAPSTATDETVGRSSPRITERDRAYGPEYESGI